MSNGNTDMKKWIYIVVYTNLF